MKARSLKCQATMALFELIKPYMIDVDELDEKRHGKQSRDLDLFDVAVYNKLWIVIDIVSLIYNYWYESEFAKHEFLIQV